MKAAGGAWLGCWLGRQARAAVAGAWPVTLPALAAGVALWTLVVSLVLGASPAQAGQGCDKRALTPTELTRGLALAERTARALDASGAQVVVLARAGQDLSRYGLQWSHVGLVYRPAAAPVAAARPAGAASTATLTKATAAPLGVWRVVHKLNHCGRADAALYRQGLGEFFMDQPHRYRAAFVVLSPALQRQLDPLLRDNSGVARMHQPRYSLVAYPWSTRFQQSNQWALETLASAWLELGERVSDRPAVQKALRQMDYRPGVVHIDAMTRLGAEVSKANVSFSDQPLGPRLAGHIETVTAESIFAWLARAGLGGPVQVIEAQD